MSRLSIEQLVTTPSPLNYLAESDYDYTKWNLGKAIIYNPGLLAIDKYVTPHFDAIRPMEESTPFAVSQIAAYQFSADYLQIFGVESSTASSNTRKVHMWTVNRQTGARSWNGFITMTLASTAVHAVRDFKIDIKNESTGTVAASGTTVTGTGTFFNTNRVAIGARIGFGSTTPSEIDTWYRITAKASDTSITITPALSSAISAGTVFVAQEYRPIYLATITTNGGIHYGKGITPDDFTSGGTTIPLAVSTDDVKAMYWLKDATTQTNTVACGAACDFANATPTSLIMYTLDYPVASNYKFYQYNIRAALTVSSGNSVSAFIFSTGNNTFTGAVSQNANLCMATANHGTGNGVKCVYLVSTTRVYRVPLTAITPGSTTVFSTPSDNIIEIPTGGTSTYAATGALNTIEYLDGIDSFVIASSHTGGNVSYITQYVSSGTEFNRQFGRDFKYLEQSAKNSYAPTIFSNQTTAFSFTNAGGNRVFGCKQGTSASTNQIYILPFGVDWQFAAVTTGRVISPEIMTPNALRYYRIFANVIPYLGDLNLGKTTEPYRLLVRTAGIRSDASTGWMPVDNTNDISGIAGASSIQFAIEFKTIGESCLPTRLLGLNLSYEDNTTDSHYAFSIGKSSLSSKTFSFWFKSAFGDIVPTLVIRLYDADTNGVLLSDDSVSQAAGLWEKTTDGVVWNAYDSADRTNSTTWIRFTPTSLADNIKVAAYITQV